MSDTKPAYVVHLEPVSHIMRVLVEGKKYLEDPYEFVVSVVWLDHETVEFRGTRDEADVGMIEPVKAALRAAGAKRMTWSHNGRRKTFTTRPRDSQ